MGIPSYFSYLIKNHNNILKKKIFLNNKVNNLYLDSNSIIYDCMRLIKIYENNTKFERELINNVCKKIEEYIVKINPNKRVFIALDGVAPVAKLEQQKNRRFKSIIEKEIFIKTNIIMDTKTWDKTAITPGTNFMKKLNKSLKTYFKKWLTKNNSSIKVIISGSDEIGEGEHKIFDYIRNNSREHKNEITFIYGLDADLIMLCLHHLKICKKIYLYRETPEFIKSISKNLNPNEDYILDIPMLSEFIIKEITNKNYNDLTNSEKNNKMSDYIFLCFFLGNDFMPHFPSLNIRTNGINILLNTYKNIFKDSEYLSDGEKINWKNVKKLIEILSKEELKNIKIEYKIRDKWEKNYFKGNEIDKKKNKFLNIPIKNREVEKYIDPFNYLWNVRYYEKLFNIDINNYYKKKIALNYLEGLEWTMNYYTKGCIDWRWKYNYNYPPLLTDLCKYVPEWPVNMIKENDNKCVSELIQLSYVLPKESNHLLPLNVRKKLESIDYYDNNYDIQWSFCKYFWESHIEFPHFSVERLESILIK